MLANLFKKAPKPKSVSEPVQVYTDMRNRVLKLVPQEVGIVQSRETPNVWGILMEMGRPKAVVTLASLADGTTSLYFGNGGGMIGAGEHAAVAQVSKSFVAKSEEYFPRMIPTESFPLPAVGRVKFYILTFSGVFTAEVGENELGNRKHDLFPLYCSGQDVITQLRLIQEQKK
jgi:hypothetical protein